MSATGKQFAATAGERLSMLTGLVRLARPTDWIKNVFVLIPVPFAWVAAGDGEMAAAFQPAAFLLGLFGFCLVNSAVYTLNDLFDAEADRLHPKKCQRPIASGRVPVSSAAVQIGVFLLAGLALTLATGEAAAVALVLVYLGVNVTYSLGAKHVALLDVFLLSSGFVIRVLLGCALIEAVPSAWLLLCTSSLAFFLGFIKRRADLTAGLDSNHRPSLRGYSRAFLDQAITICAGVALLSYALYSIESQVLVKGREMASMPFVAYGILNYLRLANTQNAGGSPVEIAYSSRSSQLCALGWAIAVTWSLGLWSLGLW
jgi:4-hydroxybenzoate polyprenyltransferase